MTVQDTSPEPAFKVAAFYRFVELADFEALREPLMDLCNLHGVKGTILLAPEGINGTIAAAPADLDSFIDQLCNGPLFGERLRELEVKFAWAEQAPFRRLRVRLKREIVTLRAPEASPANQVGEYVAPEAWNEVVGDPETVLIDTRNDYEVALGTFDGAINPNTSSFTQFKDFVDAQLDPEQHTRIAMFCTGGIRCEKASSYLLARGFKQVLHLQGGILKYLEQVPAESSTWNGACFVFDERVAVEHGLEETDYELCRACRMPVSAEDRARDDFVEGVQCCHCAGDRTETQRQRAAERQKQVLLARQRDDEHLGS